MKRATCLVLVAIFAAMPAPPSAAEGPADGVVRPRSVKVIPAGKAQADTDERRGTIQITARPWAEVYVNGMRKGVSPPLKQVLLAEGTHVIELRNPAGATLTRKVDIKHNQSVIVEHQF